MERMVVVVFDSEARASEAARVFERLNEDGVIALYTSRVLTKDATGVTTVARTYDVLPEGTMGGTAVGTMIGLIGGPVGLAIGAASGLLLGGMADLARARVAGDFVNDVKRALLHDKAAVVAEIDEEETDVVDARMKALGGFVYRRDLGDVADSEYEAEVAAIKTDIARTRAEHAASRADRQGTLQAKFDSLNEKLHKALEHAKARRHAIQQEALAKVTHLQNQAANADQDLKARQAERIAAVRLRYKKWLDESESHANVG